MQTLPGWAQRPVRRPLLDGSDCSARVTDWRPGLVRTWPLDSTGFDAIGSSRIRGRRLTLLSAMLWRREHPTHTFVSICRFTAATGNGGRSPRMIHMRLPPTRATLITSTSCDRSYDRRTGRCDRPNQHAHTSWPGVEGAGPVVRPCSRPFRHCLWLSVATPSGPGRAVMPPQNILFCSPSPAPR